MSNKIGADISTLLKLNETIHIHNLIYCLQEENCVHFEGKNVWPAKLEGYREYSFLQRPQCPLNYVLK